MTNLARVFLKAVEDDEEDDQYLFDVVLDEHFHVMAGRAIFGFWGSIKNREEGLPVILLPDGEIDLGVGIDQEEYVRTQQTNIFEKTIQVGEFVTISSADPSQPSLYEEYTYTIHKVTLVERD